MVNLQEDERKRFEAWYMEKSEIFYCSKDGSYHGSTLWAWEAWQARAALANDAQPLLYMAMNLHNKSYATSRSRAEAELFLAQSNLKNDGIEAQVIPLYRTTPATAQIEAAALRKAAEVAKKYALDELAAHEAEQEILALTTPEAAQVEPPKLGAMNDALCAFGMRWRLNGDWLTCRKCRRNHIASKHNEAFVHAAECKAGEEFETHPWYALMQILAPLYAAQVERDAKDAARYRHVRESGGNYVCYAGGGTHSLLEYDELDEAIDAAIASAKRESK